MIIFILTRLVDARYCTISSYCFKKRKKKITKYATKARAATGSFNEAMSPASCRYTLLVQTRRLKLDAVTRIIIIPTYCYNGSRARGHFSWCSACIAKYVISNPVSRFYLRRRISLSGYRLRAYILARRYIDACPTSRRRL